MGDGQWAEWVGGGVFGRPGGWVASLGESERCAMSGLNFFNLRIVNPGLFGEVGPSPHNFN
jgi:hypothetical protein